MSEKEKKGRGEEGERGDSARAADDLYMFDEEEDLGDDEESRQGAEEEEDLPEDEPEASDLPEEGGGISVKPAKGEAEDEDDDDEEEGEEPEGAAGEAGDPDQIKALAEEKNEWRRKARELEERVARTERENAERRRLEEEAKQKELEAAIERGEVDATEHEVEQLKGRLERMDQEREESQIREMVMRATPVIVQHEEAFKKEHPDFKEAIKFMHESSRAELRAKGYTDWELDREGGVFDNLDLAFATQHVYNGLDPAKAFYETAKQRGYRPPEDNASGTAEDGSGVDERGSLARGSAEGGGGPQRRSEPQSAGGRRRSLSNVGGGIAPGGRGFKVTHGSFESLDEHQKTQVLRHLEQYPELDRQFEEEGTVYVPEL